MFFEFEFPQKKTSSGSPKELLRGGGQYQGVFHTPQREGDAGVFWFSPQNWYF